ncbi:glycogen debranching N-terminal domain-containing protein [Dactylosporangium sp. CS-047395]|uniref:glycogen debranching N-terminal domain-containing protein n=1 Tax=Dactylosporangium sp. CS-047395 TaxID=3239936 RepID=UPI003D8AF113
MPQPYLHDHLTCVAAPATWLSRPAGTLTDGADGLYVEDRRLLSRWHLTLNGSEPTTLTAHRTGASSAVFSAVAPEPTLTVQRRRLAEPTGGTETITLSNASATPIAVTVTVRAATDFAALGDVRAGRAAKPTLTDPDLPRTSSDIGPAADRGDAKHGNIDWLSSDGMAVHIQTNPPAAIATAQTPSRAEPVAQPIADPEIARPSSAGNPVAKSSPAGPEVARPLPADSEAARSSLVGAEASLIWQAVVPPRGSWSAEVRLTRTDIPPIARPKRFSTLRVTADDRRLDALVRAGVQDLDALRRTDGADAYYAAGSPWYLTLFGRDALWTARLALPLGHDVAAGTLRALAARQGTEHDPATEEEPGRILHELRRPDAAPTFPPVYYGTIDATPLFVTTVAEAYRWGLPAATARSLLPNVRRALAWLTAHDGFLAHHTDGPGLTNQGWKDSDEAIQHADGRPARGPIALSEVQAYAYRAALDAAWLLEQLADNAPERANHQHTSATSPDASAGEQDLTAGPPDLASGLRGLDAWLAESASGKDVSSSSTTSRRTDAAAGADPSHADLDEAKRYRAWADQLAERFRAAFWCPDGHPAIALDGDGVRVDLVGSNMGHLLGTGLLTPQESTAVAVRLAGLRSPFGIRTVSPNSAGYDFLSYHLGSVWPHDNAIALLGLARDGHRAEAAAVIAALLDAAERFEYRLPELYGGDDLPTPYPSACRPQAWAAAVAPAILTALLGLDVDVPGGRITFAPLTPSPVGAYRIRGLKVADGELDVSVTAAGQLTVHNGPLGVTFHNTDGSPARIARPA